MRYIILPWSRQDKTRHDTTRQDKQANPSQGTTNHGKSSTNKTRQDKTRQDKTRQDKTRQDEMRPNNGALTQIHACICSMIDTAIRRIVLLAVVEDLAKPRLQVRRLRYEPTIFTFSAKFDFQFGKYHIWANWGKIRCPMGPKWGKIECRNWANCNVEFVKFAKAKLNVKLGKL